MYHSHHNAAIQVTRACSARSSSSRRTRATRPAYDRDYTMVLNDGPIGGFRLNGKGFPATQPLVAKMGERSSSAT